MQSSSFESMQPVDFYGKRMHGTIGGARHKTGSSGVQLSFVVSASEQPSAHGAKQNVSSLEPGLPPTRRSRGTFRQGLF